MLQQRPAFSGFSVNDIDAARAFYADTLGVTVQENNNGMLTLELAGGQRVLIYPKDDHRAATFTVLNFEVPDIDAGVDDLTGRGVTFERYEGMPQDDRGIMREYGPPIAWFTDPAGNVLSLIQTGEEERASS
jgi:catechol 2,3-dioxygenase-like lactoylglutathione lyase family enzyme